MTVRVNSLWLRGMQVAARQWWKAVKRYYL